METPSGQPFFTGIVLFFPQTMQIAVCIYRFHLVAFAKSETYFRLILRPQHFSLIPLFCLQRNPLDKVFRHHWMLCGTNADFYQITVHRIDRKMLFYSRVRRTRHYFFHFLSAAHNRNSRVLNHRNDISAMLANIKF